MLTKDQIQSNERAGKPVYIDAWGGEVRIRALTPSEIGECLPDEQDTDMDAVEDDDIPLSKIPGGLRYACRVVAKALVDPSFTQEELMDRDSGALRQCLQAIETISRGESVEEVKGNS